MTTRYLNGVYGSYNLKSTFTAVSVGSSALIRGGASDFGLRSYYSAASTNAGIIEGGAGGAGTDSHYNNTYYYGPTSGGNGGDGLLQIGGSAVNNYEIFGAAGGQGGYAHPRAYDNTAPGAIGGQGGVGVSLMTDYSTVPGLANHGFIEGGAGGAGGYGSVGGHGAAGGAGVTLDSAVLHNYGVIDGGAGGAGGKGIANGRGGERYGGDGGDGGAGVQLTQSNGYNFGTIAGGAGGAAGYGVIQMGQSGLAGYGVDLNAAVLVNEASGLIEDGLTAAASTITDYGDIQARVDPHTFLTTRLTNHSVLILKSGGILDGVTEMDSTSTLVMDTGGGTITWPSVNENPTIVSSATVTVFSGTGTIALGPGTWTTTNFYDRGGALLADGGTLVLNALTIKPQATVGSEAAGVLEIQGGLANSGLVSITSTGSHTDLKLTASATLSGGGAVTLAGPASRILGASTATTLTNVDNTITGSGFIGLSTMSLNNEAAGLITSEGKQGLVINLKGGSATNAGTIDCASGSVLQLQNTNLTQTGAGTLESLTGGRVTLSDAIINGGTVSQMGSGVVNIVASGGELEDLSVVGIVQWINGISCTLGGAVDNTGKLTLLATTKATRMVIAGAGATLSGGGQLNMSASTSNVIVGANNVATLTNVDNRIAGAGDIGNGSMVLINQTKGLIVGNSAKTLTIDTGANTIQNAGAIDAVGTGQLIVASAVANSGVLLAAAGTLTLEGAVTGAGQMEITKGVLNLAAATAAPVTFVTGATGQLRLTDWAGFTGAVQGLSTKGANSIDLPGFTLTGAKASFSGTTASGVLTVSNGAQSAHITLFGNYVGHTFTVANDGHGGVLVKDPSPPAASALSQALATFSAGPSLHLSDRHGWRMSTAALLAAPA